MATVKKSTKKDETAAATEAAVQEAAAAEMQSGAQQPESAGTANDTAAQGKPDTAQQSGAEGYTKYVYIGPPLPRGALNYGAVFEGTMDEIAEHLSGVLEDYPQVRRLIVPVHRLSDASARARTPGNILHKYYNDVISAVQSRKRKE